MRDFASWLERSPLCSWIGSQLWVVPLSQSIHILSVAMIVGSALMILLKVYGLNGADTSISRTAERFLPWIWAGMIGLVCTGLLQMAAEPTRAAFSRVFQLKMLLMLIALAGTYRFQARVRAAGEGAGAADLGALRTLSLTTMILWAVIAVLGRGVAYLPG